MKNIGVEVGPVRPHHRPELPINTHLPKQRVLTQRLEDGTPEVAFEINLACGSVIELDPKDEPLERLD